MLCKHHLSINAGDTSSVVSDNTDQVAEAHSWLEGSKVAAAISEVVSLGAQKKQIETHIKRVKRLIAEMLEPRSPTRMKPAFCPGIFHQITIIFPTNPAVSSQTHTQVGDPSKYSEILHTTNLNTILTITFTNCHETVMVNPSSNNNIGLHCDSQPFFALWES
jgi:hypothetical protein